MAAQGVDQARVRAVHEQELRRFTDERPRTVSLLSRAGASMPNGVPMSWMAADNDLPVYVTEGRGARFTDVDDHTYVDTNVADMASFCGYGDPRISAAVADRADVGTTFLLPSEEAVVVAEELARRYPVPLWQFTLSASTANAEAIRVARAATGRDVVVLFDGHYHGHFDEATVTLDGGDPAPFGTGLPRDVARNVRIVQFNDAEALREALRPRDVAIVLTEPALTNNVGLQMPEPGFHDALRDATREAGTVLALDETHTHIVGPGGCTRLWDLRPDVVTLGKAVGGGVPFGA